MTSSPRSTSPTSPRRSPSSEDALDSSSRLALFEGILDASGVCDRLAAQMPGGGRPRQLAPRTVLLGILVALAQGRPAHLSAAYRALVELRLADQLRLGFATNDPDGVLVATYRQFSDTHAVMMRGIDPSPVPSFKRFEPNERAAHLEAFRTGVCAELAQARLDAVTDDLLEASVPAIYRSASTSLAVDWTDHETWARPRPNDDPTPSSDPDASWGHAKRNAPGAKDCLFFGYYAQVATMVHDDGADPVPELVRRIALRSPRSDPAQVVVETLLRANRSGVALGDVLCDCGYSNRDPKNFAVPLRAGGARLVMDLHPADRGPRGTFEGAIRLNGALYCPSTPAALLELGPLHRGASAPEVQLHQAKCEELARYKLSANGAPDEAGYQRFLCPAAAGKLRCPFKSASLAFAHVVPTVMTPPAGELPRCCRQQTITVPPHVNEKTRQKYDYPSTAHRLSYARRTAAERTYASLADPSTGGIRRGWCRLFGLAKNTLMYALGVVVRNVRIVESFERHRAGEARRAALGPKIKRTRRRRHQRDETVPTGPALPEPRSSPG